MKTSRKISTAAAYAALIIISIIWVTPIFWTLLTSFRAEGGSFTSYFFPQSYTLDNYKDLLTDTSVFSYPQWFLNTLIVAVCSCVLTTVITLSVSYVISRMRFRLRKPYMNTALVLGMFPAFMSMIAVYYILKTFGLTQSLTALVLIYSGSAGLSFYVAKGFFDTIPKSLDEAAKIDGATQSQIFFKITLPLSKPIIVYTAMTAFMAPWADFIFARVIMGDNYRKYTVAVGLYQMLSREMIDKYFTQFAAGAMLIAVPVTVLFITLQRFYVEGVTGGAVKG